MLTLPGLGPTLRRCSCPWVDDIQADPLEVPDVARRKRRFPRADDPRDLNVTNLYGSAGSALHCRYRPGRGGRGKVE